MAAGVKIQLKRKAGGAFVSGELAAGECGLDTTNNVWYYSTDGTTIFRYSADPTQDLAVADQTINAAASALLTGSVLSVPSTKLKIKSRAYWKLVLRKTAAGTAANAFIVRLGTLGTIADAAVITFNLPVGTAVIDQAMIEIDVVCRGPLSGAGILCGSLWLGHNLAATGFATVPNVMLQQNSAGVNVTTAGLKMSLSCTTAALTVLTFQQVISQYTDP